MAKSFRLSTGMHGKQGVGHLLSLALRDLSSGNLRPVVLLSAMELMTMKTIVLIPIVVQAALPA